MYAVIETGGKQYRVTPGESVEVETLAGEIGSPVEFTRVLAVVDGDQVKSPAPGAKVTGKYEAEKNAKEEELKKLKGELEKQGIGRPSTYASIISTIQDRGYVKLESRRFYAEKLGDIVTERLKESFPDLMDYSFTARMEDSLDEVAEGERPGAGRAGERDPRIAGEEKGRRVGVGLREGEVATERAGRADAHVRDLVLEANRAAIAAVRRSSGQATRISPSDAGVKIA